MYRLRYAAGNNAYLKTCLSNKYMMVGSKEALALTVMIVSSTVELEFDERLLLLRGAKSA
jgi:hypothetical protein